MTCSSPKSGLRGLSTSARDNPVFDDTHSPHSVRIRAHGLDEHAQNREGASFSSLCSVDLGPGSPQQHGWKVLEGNVHEMAPARTHRALAADTREHMRVIKHEMRALQQQASPGRSASASGLTSAHTPFAASLASEPQASSSSLRSLQEQVYAIMQGQNELARDLRLTQVRRVRARDVHKSWRCAMSVTLSRAQVLACDMGT